MKMKLIILAVDLFAVCFVAGTDLVRGLDDFKIVQVIGEIIEPYSRYAKVMRVQHKGTHKIYEMQALVKRETLPKRYHGSSKCFDQNEPKLGKRIRITGTITRFGYYDSAHEGKSGKIIEVLPCKHYRDGNQHRKVAKVILDDGTNIDLPRSAYDIVTRVEAVRTTREDAEKVYHEDDKLRYAFQDDARLYMVFDWDYGKVPERIYGPAPRPMTSDEDEAVEDLKLKPGILEPVTRDHAYHNTKNMFPNWDYNVDRQDLADAKDLKLYDEIFYSLEGIVTEGINTWERFPNDERWEKVVILRKTINELCNLVGTDVNFKRNDKTIAGMFNELVKTIRGRDMYTLIQNRENKYCGVGRRGRKNKNQFVYKAMDDIQKYYDDVMYYNKKVEMRDDWWRRHIVSVGITIGRLLGTGQELGTFGLE